VRSAAVALVIRSDEPAAQLLCRAGLVLGATALRCSLETVRGTDDQVLTADYIGSEVELRLRQSSKGLSLLALQMSQNYIFDRIDDAASGIRYQLMSTLLGAVLYLPCDVAVVSFNETQSKFDELYGLISWVEKPTYQRAVVAARYQTAWFGGDRGQPEEEYIPITYTTNDVLGGTLFSRYSSTDDEIS
jgi:hypothetical protein